MTQRLVGRLPFLVSSVIGLLGLLFDHYTKVFFVTHPDQQFILIPNILHLALYINTDMALSLPLIPVFFYSIFLVVSIVLCITLFKAWFKKSLIEYTVALWIIVGAGSNFFDRVIYGGVIDFIAIPFWSVFNFADIYIVIAILVWLIYSLRQHKNLPHESNSVS